MSLGFIYFRKLDIRAIVVFCFAYFEEVFILTKKEADKTASLIIFIKIYLIHFPMILV